MRINRDQPLVNVPQPVRFVAMLAFSHQRRPFKIGGEHGFKRTVIAARGLLRDVADPGPARHIDRAGVRLEHARDHPHQR